MCDGVQPESMRGSEMQLWQAGVLWGREDGPSVLLSPTVCQAVMGALHTLFHVILLPVVLSSTFALLSRTASAFPQRENQPHQWHLGEHTTHPKALQVPKEKILQEPAEGSLWRPLPPGISCALRPRHSPGTGRPCMEPALGWQRGLTGTSGSSEPRAYTGTPLWREHLGPWSPWENRAGKQGQTAGWRVGQSGWVPAHDPEENTPSQ